MANKGKKKKVSPALIVLITLLSLSVGTLAVVVVAYFTSEAAKVQPESYVGSGALGELATEKVTLKINMENCTMTVGTKVQVTATIYPTGSTAGIMWSSSDTRVFTVDSQGNIEVIGEGIVALTANFGDAYDSIAIECVKATDEAVLNLPDYSMFTVNNGNTTDRPQSTTAANQPQSTTGADQPQGTTAANQPQGTTGANQPQSTTAAVQPTTARPQATTPGTTNPPSQTKGERETTTEYVIPTQAPYEGEKVLSTQIAERLGNYGFAQYLDNTYVYEENNAFKGEVIISSNMTHIYIKERSSGFDTAVSGVLTELLPQSYNNIWNIYTSAQTDQTVTVDGRVVRVVVPGGDGYSQIVIYN
ncbi:MAG: hypothetical protein NC086_05745 [Alistipes sp.]|nr:hypothetical protein [Alistipes sp.]